MEDDDQDSNLFFDRVYCANPQVRKKAARCRRPLLLPLSAAKEKKTNTPRWCWVVCSFLFPAGVLCYRPFGCHALPRGASAIREQAKKVLVSSRHPAQVAFYPFISY